MQATAAPLRTLVAKPTADISRALVETCMPVVGPVHENEAQHSGRLKPGCIVEAESSRPVRSSRRDRSVPRPSNRPFEAKVVRRKSA